MLPSTHFFSNVHARRTHAYTPQVAETNREKVTMKINCLKKKKLREMRVAKYERFFTDVFSMESPKFAQCPLWTSYSCLLETHMTNFNGIFFLFSQLLHTALIHSYKLTGRNDVHFPSTLMSILISNRLHCPKQINETFTRMIASMQLSNSLDSVTHLLIFLLKSWWSCHQWVGRTFSNTHAVCSPT